MSNANVLSPAANLAKSNHHRPLREWQRNAFEKWQRSSSFTWMLQAAPGAGKTEFSLHIMNHIRRDAGRSRRRFLVIVPSLEIGEGFIKKGAAAGLEFSRSSDFFGPEDKFDGVVLTYQSLFGDNFKLVQRYCAGCHVTAFLDELHHCESNSGWGQKVKDALEKAKHIMMLTGTLWRTNGERIAFVNYEEDGPNRGMAKADYEYTTAQALADRVIRHVQFDLAKGSVTNVETNATEIMTGDATLTAAQKMMRPLVDAEGTYAAKQFIAAHNRLMQIRKHVPDAGGLYLASDQYQATGVASMITRITGEKPTLVISDEPKSTEKVNAYRKSDSKWIVAVRMISEGCDIPRLAVLVWGTTTCTELFFRQAVGRVIRRRDDESLSAFVFLPAHPELRTFADNYLAQQAEAKILKERAEAALVELGERDRNEEFPAFVTEHHGTEAMVWTGDEETPTDVAAVQMVMMRCGLDYQQAKEAVQTVRDELTRPTMIAANPIQDEPIPMIDRMKAIRAEIRRMVNQIACLTGEPHEKINGRYKRRFGGSLDRLDEETLKRRKQATVEERDRARQRNPARWAQMIEGRKEDAA